MKRIKGVVWCIVWLLCPLSSLLAGAVARADQCPAIDQVLVNGRWQVPPGWQVVKLSPLATTAGGHKQIQARGLYQVYYLRDKQQLRCIYSRPGMGVADNTYVIAKHVIVFTQGGSSAWVFDGNSVWSCQMTKMGAQHHRIVLSPDHCIWAMTSPLVTMAPRRLSR